MNLDNAIADIFNPPQFDHFNSYLGDWIADLDKAETEKVRDITESISNAKYRIDNGGGVAALEEYQRKVMELGTFFSTRILNGVTKLAKETYTEPCPSDELGMDRAFEDYREKV